MACPLLEVKRKDHTHKKPGRPKKQPADFKAAAAEQWWQYAYRGLMGEPVPTGGPTGKSIKKPLSEQSQVKLWEVIGKKLNPDLSAQAIKADIETTTYVDPPSSRNLGRAVLAVLSKSRLEDAEAEVSAIGTRDTVAPYARGADMMVTARGKLEDYEARQLQIEHEQLAGQPDEQSAPAGTSPSSSLGAVLGDDSDAATPTLASGQPRGVVFEFSCGNHSRRGWSGGGCFVLRFPRKFVAG
ncbi:MAG: hypothetical protein ABUJ98_15020 [Hyphomicrobium sp.]